MNPKINPAPIRIGEYEVKPKYPPTRRIDRAMAVLSTVPCIVIAPNESELIVLLKVFGFNAGFFDLYVKCLLIIYLLVIEYGTLFLELPQL